MFSLPELLFEPRFMLVVLPWEARSRLLEVASVLVQKGPLVVLDGGNQFDAYRMARLLRHTSVDVNTLLGRIRLSRAFTCYQMAVLAEKKYAPGVPTLILDLLATFYDENIAMMERRRLLLETLRLLRERSYEAPLVVSAHPKPLANGGMDWLLQSLRKSADRVWEQVTPEMQLPPTLF